MRVAAYCAHSFRKATKKGAGVRPYTCPPLSAEFFSGTLVEGCDLIWFDLHGRAGASAWYGDRHIVALTADKVRSFRLGGAVVFAANCHLADEDSPMLDALLDAGASYVIAGAGSNWGGVERMTGTSLLGLWFRRYLAMGLPVLKALALAKRTARLLSRDSAVLRDTLAFRAHYRRRV